MAELGNFTINITYPDNSDIEAFGELIGKLVEDKYKEMLKEESGSLKSQYLVNAAYFEIETEQKPPPFIVQQGQVYINQSMIKDSSIQSDNYKEASSCWKLGKNGELELNTKTSKVVIDNEVLELFDKNGTLRVRVQL